MPTLEIRPPRDAAELSELWALNHAVFSEELGQHARRPDGRLVDKFHGKNLYFGAWCDGRAAGMICAHWQPPFSAVGHFGETAARWVLPGRTAEARLFALRPEYRRGGLAMRLGAWLVGALRARGMERLLITGVSTRKRLYEHVGFRVVGPPVRDGAATFHPMVLDLPEAERRHADLLTRIGGAAPGA